MKSQKTKDRLRKRLKVKKCQACGEKFDVMMTVHTSMLVCGFEKKSKLRFFCPSCMRKVVATLDRIEGKGW